MFFILNQVFKAIIASAAIIIGCIGAAAPEAKAYTNCYSYGGSTTCSGSGGSFNSYTYGGSTSYYGTDSYGNSYSGSCYTYGGSTTCY